MVTQGPDDPLCCPTMLVQRLYELDDDGLTLISETSLSEDEMMADEEPTFSPENDATVATLRMGDPDIFWLDPMMVTVHSGAMSGPGVEASLQGVNCAGVIDESPEVVLEWVENEWVDTLRIFMLSLGDPTLVVVTPEGDIVCNDDLNPLVLDPYLEFENPTPGRYAIYVGSFNGAVNTPGFPHHHHAGFQPSHVGHHADVPRHVSPDAIGDVMEMDVLDFEADPVAELPEDTLTVEEHTLHRGSDSRRRTGRLRHRSGQRSLHRLHRRRPHLQVRLGR
ncbi:MAG: hypothetical protein R2856_31710 [Caldilineaceae bacterium]